MKKRLTIDEKKAELRAAGRKVKNTLTDAEVNKQYRAFLAETDPTKSRAVSADFSSFTEPGEYTPKEEEAEIEILDPPLTEDAPLMDEEAALDMEWQDEFLRASLNESAASQTESVPGEVAVIDTGEDFKGLAAWQKDVDDHYKTEFDGVLREKIDEEIERHRLPARVLADYLAILDQLSKDGDKSGDKSPVVVEWLRDNLAPEEFAHKYAHRGIK
jgi:hypothetical protein